MSALESDEPIPLREACKRFFAGAITPSALRTEAKKGNLEIIQIARKDFVTGKAIKEMMNRCRVNPTRPDSGSAPTATNSISRTDQGVSPQDALRAILKPNSSLPNTSPKNTKPRAEVVRIR